MNTENIYLSQHAQAHVDGGQQGPKRRGHIGVERWRGEAEHEQGPILCQVHALTEHGDIALALTQKQKGENTKLAIRAAEPADLVQQYLAAVWSEVLQSGQRFAEDLQQAALHRQQGLLLRLLSLPSTGRLFRRGLGAPLCPGEGTRGQRFAIFGLKHTNANMKP